MNPPPRVLVSHATHHTDCNCACADDEDQIDPDLSFPITSQWVLHPHTTWEPLDESHVVGISPAGNGTVAVLDRTTQRLLAARRSPQFASPEGVVTVDDREFASVLKELASAGLITPWPQPQATHAAQPAMLTAWLHLTHACNLRCSYCFVQHNAQRMSEAVGRRAVDAAFRAAAEGDYKSVKLKYAGGEPTLVFDLVKSLHRHARQVSQRRGIVLRELLLSNGVRLSDDMLAYLQAEAIRLMISLDGVGDQHNRQRPTVRGGATFEAVADAIDRCLLHDLTPDLSITVTAQNAGGLAQVVEFALDRSLRFNLNFVRALGEATPAEHRAGDEKLIDGVRAALQVIQRRLPPYRLIDGLLDRSTFHSAHDFACGAGRNYLAIGPDGRVARCHTELNAAVGHVDDPNLLSAVRFAEFPGTLHAVAASRREGCSTCRWRPWCGGGCPLLANKASGAWDQRSPYCTVYQALYPEVLRTEGMRLLKYATALANT